MQLGPVNIATPLIVAPMAGVTDAPFRALCLESGADLAVHEMVAANPDLKSSRKSQQRLKQHQQEPLRWVQIVGADPETIAEGAAYNVAQGAEVIDINMGCPAKKVCKKAAGSALLADPGLVAEIFQETRKRVAVPVTVKIRTGTDDTQRNAVEIAKLAEAAGLSCVSIHGRTRAQKFTGEAEYDSIRAVKQAISIPVIANGDIDSPQKAQKILAYTGADGLMIGRGAYGNPWIFAQIKAHLNGIKAPEISWHEKITVLCRHIANIHQHYGEPMGVRIARKHIGWYLQHLGVETLRKSLNSLESGRQQIQALQALVTHTELPV